MTEYAPRRARDPLWEAGAPLLAEASAPAAARPRFLLALAQIQLFALAVGAGEFVVRLAGGTIWTRLVDVLVAKGALCAVAWLATAFAFLTRPRDGRSLFRRTVLPLLLTGSFLFWLQRMAWRPSDHAVPAVLWLAVTAVLIVAPFVLSRLRPTVLAILTPLLVFAYQVGVGDVNVHTPAASLREVLPIGAAALATSLLILALIRLARPVRPSLVLGAGALLALAGVVSLLAYSHRSFVEMEERPAPYRGGATAGQPNLVLVVMDTLRADRIAPNGYTVRETTPSLNRLAGMAQRYSAAYAASSWTVPSVATMFTGERPDQHGLSVFGQPLPNRLLLAELLARRGYYTIGVTANQLIDHRGGFTRGFNRFATLSRLASQHGPSHAFWTDGIQALQYLQARKLLPRFLYDWGLKARAGDAVDTALREIEQSPKDAPLFVYLHVIDPHSLCDAPHDSRSAHWPVADADYRFDAAWSLEYDREIRYMDAQLGRFLDAASRRLDPARTIVAVVADHGEELGESGLRGHGANLHDAVLKVPLIIRLPGQPAGVEPRAFSLDQLRTALLHAVDPELPAPALGWPLLAHLVPPGEERRTMRSAQDGAWKYVATYDAGEMTEEALYRLPDEQTNRIASHRALGERLRAHLPPVPRVANPKLSPEAIEKLRSLSYIH
jgi:arylsulfatase A-like enzyme